MSNKPGKYTVRRYFRKVLRNLESLPTKGRRWASKVEKTKG